MAAQHITRKWLVPVRMYMYTVRRWIQRTLVNTLYFGQQVSDWKLGSDIRLETLRKITGEQWPGKTAKSRTCAIIRNTVPPAKPLSGLARCQDETRTRDMPTTRWQCCPVVPWHSTNISETDLVSATNFLHFETQLGQFPRHFICIRVTQLGNLRKLSTVLATFWGQATRRLADTCHPLTSQSHRGHTLSHARPQLTSPLTAYKDRQSKSALWNIRAWEKGMLFRIFNSW